jgi:hypothetical protein
VGGGEGGDHHDRHRLGAARAEGAQDADPVHAGHGEVERQRVRPVLVAGGEGLVAVGRGGHDVEPLPAERVGQHPAHQARVVGDDDAPLGDGLHGLPLPLRAP